MKNDHWYYGDVFRLLKFLDLFTDKKNFLSVDINGLSFSLSHFEPGDVLYDDDKQCLHFYDKGKIKCMIWPDSDKFCFRFRSENFPFGLTARLEIASVLKEPETKPKFKEEYVSDWLPKVYIKK